MNVDMGSALSRIQEIKSHFASGMAEGIVGICPSSSTTTASVPASVKPYFPDNLKEAIQKAQSTSGASSSDYDNLIQSAAAKTGLDSNLIKAVIQAESGFNSNAVSPVGAQGLMQLMPSTGRALGVSDLSDPARNIEAGAKYLKQQLDRFGSVELALAAYNAGPGSVVKYGGVPPFRETKNYVQRVLSYRDSYATQ